MTIQVVGTTGLTGAAVTNTAPAPVGTQAVGVSGEAARADHVHAAAAANTAFTPAGTVAATTTQAAVEEVASDAAAALASARIGLPLIARALRSARIGSDEVLAATAYYSHDNNTASQVKTVYPTPGLAGNAARMQIVVAGLNTPLSTSLAGDDLTINAATDGAGAATSTAAQVKTEVEAQTDWTVDLKSGGGGVVTDTGGYQSLHDGADLVPAVPMAGHCPNVVDEVALEVGDLVLYTYGSADAGLYRVTTVGTGADGEWARVTTPESAGYLLGGQMIGVSEGTVNAGTVWAVRAKVEVGVGVPSWGQLAFVA